jgi:glycosyltransferase involved in cell wall biosynthesis
VIHSPDDWGKADLDVDVVLHMAGPTVYWPKPYNINLLLLDASGNPEYEAYAIKYDAVLRDGGGQGKGSDKRTRAHAFLMDLFEVIEKLREPHRTVAFSRTSPAVAQPTTGPLVSVLMSTYNRQALLPAALCSVCAQTYQDWELLLVNDGGDAVDEAAAHQKDDRIRVVDTREHRGKGYAVNRAFEHAKGEFIAYLDDDDIWYPEHLQHLMLPLRTIPGIDMAYTDAYDVTLVPSPSGGWHEATRELRHSSQVTIEDLLWVNHIQGIVVAHRRTLFERVGGMDERLDVLLDWDLWRRMAALSYPYHVSHVTAEHFHRDGSGTDTFEQITDLARHDPTRYLANRLRILRKDLPLAKDSPLYPKLDHLRRRALSDLILARGETYRRKKSYDKARRCLDVALRHTPDHPGANRQLGILAMEQNRVAEAFEHFHRNILAERAEAEEYCYAALAALILKKAKEALHILAEAERNLTDLDDRVKSLIQKYRERAFQMTRGRDQDRDSLTQSVSQSTDT